MPTKKIFFFDWNSNFDADLPAWAQDSKMFIGQYVSLRGLPTSWRNTKQAIASNRSGKVTNGFMKALIRAAMIDSGANADGFGLNDRYAMGEMTLDGTFTGTTINANGLVACVLYDRTTGKFLKSSGYDHKTNGSAPFYGKHAGFRPHIQQFLYRMEAVSDERGCLPFYGMRFGRYGL